MSIELPKPSKLADWFVLVQSVVRSVPSAEIVEVCDLRISLSDLYEHGLGSACPMFFPRTVFECGEIGRFGDDIHIEWVTLWLYPSTILGKPRRKRESASLVRLISDREYADEGGRLTITCADGVVLELP